MLLAPIKSFRVCTSHQSDRRIRVRISHQSDRSFCSLVWEVFKFQRSRGDSERVVVEYSKIEQIIVKADRGKAIAWRSVSCKMTCYHITDEKTLQILSLHFVPTLQSAVYILYPVCCLHFVLTGIRGTNTVYFWLQLFAQHTIYHKIHVCELIRHFRSFPR